jgi:hypothetical protein
VLLAAGAWVDRTRLAVAATACCAWAAAACGRLLPAFGLGGV